MVGDARVPADWQVLDGDGGPGDEVVREFTLFDGGGERMSPKDDKPGTPEPVIGDGFREAVEIVRSALQTAHDKHITSLSEAHEREVERLTGSRWTAAAAIRALVHPGPAGGHRIFDGHRIVLNIEVANLSPFTWEATDVECPRIGWASDEKAKIAWHDVLPSLTDRIVPIAREFVDPIEVTVRVSGDISRRFAGSQRLYIEPAGITLVVRRGGSGKKEAVPVRLAAGPIFIGQ